MKSQSVVDVKFSSHQLEFNCFGGESSQNIKLVYHLTLKFVTKTNVYLFACFFI